MPEFPIPSARILLVSQIQGGNCPHCPPVRYAYERRLLTCQLARLHTVNAAEAWYYRPSRYIATLHTACADNSVAADRPIIASSRTAAAVSGYISLQTENKQLYSQPFKALSLTFPLDTRFCGLEVGVTLLLNSVHASRHR